MKKDYKSICNILYYIISIVVYIILFIVVAINTHITSFTWLFFIVTFIIPFVLSHLPFILEKKWESEIILSTIISFIYLIIIVPLIEFGIVKYSTSFTSHKWIEHTELRYLMIDKLEDKYELVGMNKNEIIDLLGKADFSLDDYFCYFIGSEEDIKYYCLTLKNDVVVEVFNNIDK